MIMRHVTRLLIVIMALLPSVVMAESFSQLWKRFAQAQKKDLPKTELQVLDKIISNAETDKAYGHLVKAQLLKVAVQSSVSPDSLAPQRARLEAACAKTQDKVLRAIYSVVIGSIYESDYSVEDGEEKAEQYFADALKDPDALAAVKDKTYEPLVNVGVDSKIFNHDLLHVIGFTTGDYKTLHDYYSAHGNRQAAFYTALKITEEAQKTDGERIASIDSLINLYGDLPIACEGAILRCNYMNENNNAQRKTSFDYLTKAIDRWKDYPRIGVLRNQLATLIAPSFGVNIYQYLLRPTERRKVVLGNVRNISSVVLKVYQLNAGTKSSGSVDDVNEVEKLKRGARLLTQYGKSLTVDSKDSYSVSQDSMYLEPMPIGAYLLEFAASDKDVEPQYFVARVSNLQPLWIQLPGKKVRMAVVNATTGEPVGGAKVAFSTTEDGAETVLTTDAKGECTFEAGQYTFFRTFTDTDKYSSRRFLRSYFHYDDNNNNSPEVSLFTDRSIYRPGQTVHVAMLAYQKLGNDDYTVVSNKEYTLELFDANGKKQSEQKLTTDGFGTASADFILPTGLLAGNFSVKAGNKYKYFSVEEYKRPTFEVSFDDYKAEYREGDTITVVGHAKSYAGVPVQGAKVVCKITRERSWWWPYGSGRGNSYGRLATDTVETDAGGSFKVCVPLILPKRLDKSPMYCNINVQATVTDAGGESHDGMMSLPLGSKPTAFMCDLPKQALKDSLRSVCFSYRNNAGKEIPGTVDYTIDGTRHTAKANEAVGFSKVVAALNSGKHSLLAVCGNDTVKRDFVVFSMDDKRCAVDTHDWFYASAREFPRDGGPVYVQLGSSDSIQHVVYAIISGNKLLENGVVDLKNELYTREFKYTEEYGDGITALFAWVKGGKTYRHTQAISKPMRDDRLIVKWTTFRDKLVPGQREEWTLNVSRPDNKAVKAQLMATMFDKSLDQIRPHNWWFGLSRPHSCALTWWFYSSLGFSQGYSGRNIKWLQTKELDFSSFNDYNNVGLYGGIRFSAPVIKKDEVRVLASADAAAPMMAKQAAGDYFVRGMSASALEANAGGSPNLADMLDENPVEATQKGDDGEAEVQLRENLQETAFFYPNLETDDDGNIKVKFTLPESVTTWRFIGLAHDREMHYGMLQGETVAKKTVMVQPNVPRFLRVGDKATISSRIINTSDKAVKGRATMTLIDAESGKTVYEKSVDYKLDANATTAVSFAYSPDTADKMLICRITAAGSGYSDGEQHYLPILPDKELVTNTVAFTQIGKGVKTIDLTKLFEVKDAANSLTVEYTNNPAWLMVQALPYVANANEKNAISLTAAYYANTLASNLLRQSPAIKRTLDTWRQEQGKETTLMSSLEKNQELKTLVLDETPWVMDAANEGEQKAQLINFFDENNINNKLEGTLRQLQELQRADGSFAWWPGMGGSPYITVSVVDMFARLNSMIGEQASTRQILSKAFSFLDSKIAKEVAELKKAEQKGAKINVPSEFACNYLYASALAKRPATANVNYLLNLLRKTPSGFSIYGKANAAVILSLYGRSEKAKEYLQSAMEYTVYKDEMGRYYDTPKAQYSWFDYRIPTQAATIEALQRLQPADTATISDMQRWLLQSKRTQAWDTPINSVDAIYAFLNGQTSKLMPADNTPMSLAVDGKPLSSSVKGAAIGYVKGRYQGANMRRLTAKKTTSGVSWGAVYAQFMQPSADVKGSSMGLTVAREIVSGGKLLKVGDKVKVRITVTADRDYDFVQVVDNRAACMEPVGQLSGYHWGYYCSPKDNSTNYYFDRLSKGRHVIETEYYIDREGDYKSGTCTAQCAYSPEFMGREGAMKFVVK